MMDMDLVTNGITHSNVDSNGAAGSDAFVQRHNEETHIFLPTRAGLGEDDGRIRTEFAGLRKKRTKVEIVID